MIRRLLAPLANSRRTKNDKMKKNIRIILLTTLFAVLAVAANAQVANNPPYTLEQSVIASGGGTSADTGSKFSLTGTIGQAITDTSSAAPFTIRSGFFAAVPLVPTAATVTISGSIRASDGRGLLNAQITLTDYAGHVRTARSGSGGAYQFDEVEVGQTYILTVVSKQYEFQPQLLTLTEANESLNFTATKSKNRTF